MIPLPPQQWAERIFGCADLRDKRRTKRLVQVAGDLSAHMGSSLASSCEGNLAAVVAAVVAVAVAVVVVVVVAVAVVEGACRLIENESVEPDAIPEAGFQVTALAANDAQLILAIKDSTTLSYKHSVRTELGDISGPEDSISKGIWAHSVMLPDADNEQTVERLRLLCAGNVQRLAVRLIFVAVRLLQIREALMLPYIRKQKDDKMWNEKTPASRVVSEQWKP